MNRHQLANASFRNPRKAILFGKWIGLGSVTVCFDATLPEVMVPPEMKVNFDRFIICHPDSCKLVLTGIEGVCKYPGRKDQTFDFFISWAAVTAFESNALNERHIYMEDYQLAQMREQNRSLAKTGKPLPS